MSQKGDLISGFYISSTDDETVGFVVPVIVMVNVCKTELNNANVSKMEQ